jgi:uncharacterized protein YcbK (DUF882 family)
MQLTNNFSKSEFESKDGASMPIDVQRNIQELAANLQALRDEVDRPITVTSGYRSPSHNEAIGGAKHSFHVAGMAADIKVAGMKPQDVRRVILRLIDEGKMKQGGIGVYSSWVHYDIRGTEARW